MKIVQKFLFLIVVLISMLNIACEKKDIKNKCDLSDPVEELPWLKNLIVDFGEYQFIYSAIYKGQTVFIYGNCNPLVNYIPYVYNCDGEVIANAVDILDDLSDHRSVWIHEDSKCGSEK